jgi:prolyl oligopeptidase
MFNSTFIRFNFIFSALILIIACKTETKVKDMQYPKISFSYPSVKIDSTVVDDFYKTKVADPYRWLEDENSQETKDWVASQNKLTFGYLDQIPFRSSIKERYTKLWNFERFGVPQSENGKLYFFKNNGLQNQSVLYKEEPGKKEELVLDPNTFSKDGTVALGGIEFSKDGKYLAYQISRGGSDWSEINVLELASGKRLDDSIQWVKFSGVAWKDNGFYYSRYDAPKAGKNLSQKNEFHKIYFHKLGTKQSEDILIYKDPSDPQTNVGAGVSEDGKWLIMSMSKSTSGNALSIKDLTNPESKAVPIVKKFDKDFSFIGNDGDNIFVQTNDNAPNQKIVSINTKNPQESNWKIIVPEGKEVIENSRICGGKLLVTIIKDASSRLLVYDLTGKTDGEVTLPGIGTLAGISGKPSDPTAYFAFTSFTIPTSVYSLDIASKKISLYRSPKLPDFDVSKYETKQIFFTSKDGTKVPMFITHKKGLVLNGKNPTILYGYGGFNVPVLPSFSIKRLVLLENDGVFAVANIRGGGEYGETWHRAGTKLQKQNVFDDFQFAAEYLIKEKFTDSKHLAIEGGSNGGLLVGACITQRPELYRVAFPAVGVLDMLRYHKFTIGWAWADDYGRSDESKEMFEYLYKYSPLNNCKPADYPSTMIITADHDDRVVPAHSFKFASALQKAQNGQNPILIRVDVQAGHGAGKPTTKLIEEAADQISFLFYEMNHPVNYTSSKK